MSTTDEIGYEGTVGQVVEQEAEIEVVDETPELRPTVELEIQAKVDLNHFQGVGRGLTLAEEERMIAREWEIERTRRRIDRSQDSDREARTRNVAVEMCTEPKEYDPRQCLSREDLGAVNKQARRIAERVGGITSAAVSRILAEHVERGADTETAVVLTFEEVRLAPGVVVPIEDVKDVPREEVNVEGVVDVLWEPKHPSIQQVGLLEDETGRIKFTTWRKSGQPMVREGDLVRFASMAKNWYEGRVSVALTGQSRVTVLDQVR